MLCLPTSPQSAAPDCSRASRGFAGCRPTCLWFTPRPMARQGAYRALSDLSGYVGERFRPEQIPGCPRRRSRFVSARFLRARADHRWSHAARNRARRAVPGSACRRSCLALVYVAVALGMLVITPLNVRLTRRAGPRNALVVSLLLTAFVSAWFRTRAPSAEHGVRAVRFRHALGDAPDRAVLAAGGHAVLGFAESALVRTARLRRCARSDRGRRRGHLAARGDAGARAA